MCTQCYLPVHVPAGIHVGSVFVRARSDANEQRILAEMHRIFKPYSIQKNKKNTQHTIADAAMNYKRHAFHAFL